MFILALLCVVGMVACFSIGASYVRNGDVDKSKPYYAALVALMALFVLALVIDGWRNGSIAGFQ